MSTRRDDGARVLVTRVAPTRDATDEPAASRPPAGPRASRDGARVAKAASAELADPDTHPNLNLETHPC
jgi:hypothetical protein